MMPTDENMQTPVVEETGTDTDTRRGETNTEWRVGREGKREGRRGAFGARPGGDSINDEVTQKMSRVCQHFAYVGAAPSIRQCPPTGTATSSVYAEGLAPSPMKPFEAQAPRTAFKTRPSREQDARETPSATFAVSGTEGHRNARSPCGKSHRTYKKPRVKRKETETGQAKTNPQNSAQIQHG